MHDLNCKKCGGSNFLEDSCELFCLDCGNMDKLTSNFSQSQDVVKVAWSLSIKEGPQNTSKLPDSENPFDNLDILNILMKSYSRSLSHLLDCQELHEYIGRLWITYVHQITKQSDTETNCNESRVKKRLYFNPSKYLLLKICFIAIKSLGLVFTYCDLKKIIIENKISYYKWKPELSDINVPKNSKKSLRNDFLPPGDQFYSVSAKLAGYIGHATPKTLDLDSFIFKFIHDLNFSKSIHSIAHALNQIWFENFTKTSRCKFPFNKLYIFSEIYAMALVILSARMYFYSSWVETPIGLKSGSSNYICCLKEEFSEWCNSCCSMREMNYDEFIRTVYVNKTSRIPSQDSRIIEESCKILTNTDPDIDFSIVEYKQRLEWVERVSRFFKQFSYQNRSNISESREEIKDLTPLKIKNHEENCMSFSTISKPLRNIFYNMPDVLIDFTPQFDLIVLRATQKLSISKQLFLEILSDIEWELLSK